MGIRALDQNIEASLANGITTISIRARYISILTWAIGQYCVDESAGGRVHHDKEAGTYTSASSSVQAVAMP